MTAIRQDITIEQGADYDTPFMLRDDCGNPDDITGRSYELQIRTSFDAPNALLTLSSATGTLVPDVNTGGVRPVIGYLLTTTFLPGSYVYDLKERTVGGKLRRRRCGAANVTQEVTTVNPPDPSTSPYTDAQGNAYTDAQGNAYTAS